MTRIENEFIRNHFSVDNVEDLPGGWKTIRNSVLNARRICENPEQFPNANLKYLGALDLEGTICLLQAPVQYIV